jgi:hypothetical protein
MVSFVWNPLTICKIALASLQAFANWPSSSGPSIVLTLTPNFNASQHIVSLSAVLEVQNVRQVNSGEVLLEMKMVEGNVPSNDYRGTNALKARDDNGVLPLTFQDAENGMRYWYSSRTTKGITITEFEAFPREVDEHTPVGPRVDLRMDEGGLIGAGSTFIPVPPNRDTLFDVHLNWDLDGAPEGTTAVWSFGDGIEVRKTGTTEVLFNTVFMVGPINNYTKQITPAHVATEDFGVYWFGNPRPFDVQNVARTCDRLFERMASFFKDTQRSYRIFIRFNPYRGFGGNGFVRSFVLEYDPYVTIDPDDLLYLLAHEMVHNWPLMEQESKGDSEEGAWYTEGMSISYAVYAAIRYVIGYRIASAIKNTLQVWM